MDPRDQRQLVLVRSSATKAPRGPALPTGPPSAAVPSRVWITERMPILAVLLKALSQRTHPY